MKAVQSQVFSAGIDEVGRGPIAGPVVAATVVLDSSKRIDGIQDSKTLSAKKRSSLAIQIMKHAACWAVGHASVQEVDELNILNATLLAMQRSFETAVRSFDGHLAVVQVDGNQAPTLSVPVRCVVQGDRKVASISAASILAKVARDRIMVEANQFFPGYGFERHKGYPTRQHLDALQQLGSCSWHRQSFQPVRSLLQRVQ